MDDLDLAEELVERLNSLIEDPEVLDLFDRFMKLSLLSPPSVLGYQSLQFMVGPKDTVLLRFLGLLNGIVGVKEDGWGYIAAKFDDSDRLINFQVLSELQIT